MRDLRLMAIVSGLMWLFGLIVLPFLPDPAPIHWNVVGEIDGYGSRWLVAFLLPFVATLMAGLALLLPRLDSRGQGYVAFWRTYALMMNSLTLFLAAVHLITVGVAVGWPVSVPRLFSLGAAVLIVVLGNELGRVKPNHFVGIRTPWTLADDEVWRVTHRMGARLLVGSGVLAVLCSLVVSESWLFMVCLSLVGLAALATIPYSYIVWRRLRRSGQP